MAAVRNVTSVLPMANSVVSAWENQRLLRCEKWPRKDKTCRRTKCWNKATNDSIQLRRPRPRLTEAVWTHPTSQLLFKSVVLRQDFTLWGQKLELWKRSSQETNSTWWTKSSWRQLTFLKTSHSVWEKLLVSTATPEDKDYSSASAKLLVWQKMQMHQGLCQVQFSLS